jgi:tetratricopeptide (TPR) repeat protein
MTEGVAGRDGSESIAPEDIRAQLDRVLASDIFRSAPQLTSFLSYVVEQALAGRAGELKGYTIAVEAFGRPADFDPQSDPIVRVEAGRLRKALNLYFAADGVRDPVRIAIPVGAYVPSFTRLGFPESEAAAAAAAVEPAQPAPVAAKPWRIWAYAAAALILTAAITLVARHQIGTGPEPGVTMSSGDAQAPRPATTVAPDQSASPQAAEPVAAPASLPVIAVVIAGDIVDPAVEDAARLFMRHLVDTMARFDDLLVVKTPGTALRPEEGADYVLSLNTSRAGDKVEGFVRLSAAKDGRVVWTTSGERTLEAMSDGMELRELAQRLAIRLAQPFGILHADLRLATLPPGIGCIYQALNFRRHMKADDHLAARNCLDALVARDPDFHPAWSHLALLTADEYASGLNARSGSPLDRALAAAITAVRLAPASARAHQALMEAQFLRGMTEEALKSGREALTRNPFDPDIMADLGARYVQLDRAAEGLPLLERAAALSGGRPSWYDTFLYFAAYLTGTTKLAENQAALLKAEETPLALVARAVASAAAGDRVELEETWRMLGQAEPLFALDPRLYLARKGFSSAASERILAAIGQAGLPPR